ncbi:sigma factor-like helix-turn-helix DNA-binding protein [Streptomyces sp. SGAir0957]
MSCGISGPAGRASMRAARRAWACTSAASPWRRTRNRLLAHRRHGPQEELPGLSPNRVALIAALRRLTPQQRQAVVLHHLLDLPVEQVARETGASSGAVRTRLSRARGLLGVELSDITPTSVKEAPYRA